MEFHRLHLIVDGRNIDRNIESENKCWFIRENKNKINKFRWKPSS